MRYTLVILLLSICQLNAVESQFNTHFQRRFGPNSPIYNEPLYFSPRRTRSKRRPLKKGTYREQIKQKLQQNMDKKKRPTHKQAILKYK